MLNKILKISALCAVFPAILSFVSCPSNPGSNNNTNSNSSAPTTTILDDNFTRPNQSGLGGGWVLTTGTASINNNLALLTGTSGSSMAIVTTNMAFTSTYFKITANYSMDPEAGLFRIYIYRV